MDHSAVHAEMRTCAVQRFPGVAFSHPQQILSYMLFPPVLCTLALWCTQALRCTQTLWCRQALWCTRALRCMHALWCTQALRCTGLLR
eukprot:3627389-Pyramimonas_sp.AAC.1